MIQSLSKHVILLLFVFINGSILAQSGTTSSVLFNDIKKLANTQTVMYIAAHPDDENTRLISWLTNKQHAETYYLSLTRGDGGQNLIGTEKGSALGVLRTQELLEARKVDGGLQLFTRANDFGYSKNVDETLTIWDKNQLLNDIVWSIRKYQPDILITRFDPDSNGKTHGHHTTSALLAKEAFTLAGDPKAFPEQLEQLKPWTPERILFNTSWWFYGSREAFEQADRSNLYSVDIGEYYPELGLSNNEIAAISRSKHACQGFGMALQRGSELEYLELLDGSRPTTSSIFSGIPNRYPQNIQKKFDALINQFDFSNPENSFEQLTLIYKSLNAQPASLWRDRKLNAISDVLLQMKGIYTEWVTASPYAIPGATVQTELEVTNRGSKPLRTSLKFNDNQLVPSQSIGSNESLKQSKEINIPQSSAYDNPYWLDEEMSGIGQYVLVDPNLTGNAERPKTTQATITYDFETIRFDKAIDLSVKSVNPAEGEIYEPFYVLPPATVTLDQMVYLFANDQSQSIVLTVTAFEDNISGTASLSSDNNLWKISQPQSLNIAHSGDKSQLIFQVWPPKNQVQSQLFAQLTIKGKNYNQSLEVIDYDHIDKQIVLKPAQAQMGKVDLVVPKVRVAYIEGSGDDVVESLQQVGITITDLAEEEWSDLTPNNYDVALVGIRAFNVLDHADRLSERLNAFAKAGGTVIVQYQTYRGLKVDQFAPYKLTLGRDRIAEEDAQLTMLDPNHPVFNTPNKINSADFNGWVQERGLYFATEWDSHYTPLLEGQDRGEEMKQGIFLVSDYGQGKYVYTGLSFFRELPAGVPGAYRLMANLLALE